MSIKRVSSTIYKKQKSMGIAFKQVNWLQQSNIYEVNIRQYTQEGTFKAFSNHLPRLKNMGVEVLWLMPITPIGKVERLGSLGSYYACSSYTKINPEFGTLADFKLLVQMAHALGLKVIIDWVANHTAHDHEWTVNHKDFYVLDAAENFTERNGWKDVIDLNYSNPALQTAMVQAMQFWIDECNIDGFRCDMAHLVPLSFWQKARTACDALKPLYWLAECEDVSYHNVFDISYGWHFMHVTEQYAKGEKGLQDVIQVLHSYSQYPAKALKLLFTTNHDENSWNGTEYEKYGQAATTWAVLTCTWPNSIPLLYSGQEAANKKRLEFFNKDYIEWGGGFVLEKFYTALLQLHTYNVITTGETFILPTQHQHVLAFIRKKDKETVLVILNFSSDNRIHVPVNHKWLQGNFTNLFSNLSYQFSTTETFELMANDYLVYTNFGK